MIAAAPTPPVAPIPATREQATDSLAVVSFLPVVQRKSTDFGAFRSSIPVTWEAATAAGALLVPCSRQTGIAT